ncbi:hypothetical protein V8G54_010246, partial [Vigna mungo]
VAFSFVVAVCSILVRGLVVTLQRLSSHSPSQSPSCFVVVLCWLAVTHFSRLSFALLAVAVPLAHGRSLFGVCLACGRALLASDCRRACCHSSCMASLCGGGE